MPIQLALLAAGMIAAWIIFEPHKKDQKNERQNDSKNDDRSGGCNCSSEQAAGCESNYREDLIQKLPPKIERNDDAERWEVWHNKSMSLEKRAIQESKTGTETRGEKTETLIPEKENKNERLSSDDE